MSVHNEQTRMMSRSSAAEKFNNGTLQITDQRYIPFATGYELTMQYYNGSHN
jgi:hypothetical protein